MQKLNRKNGFAAAIAAFSLMTVSACTAAEEEGDAAEVAVEESEEAIENAQDITAAMEICDEDGNRYASEQEAADAGLEPAQYGATYCEYLEE